VSRTGSDHALHTAPGAPRSRAMHSSPESSAARRPRRTDPDARRFCAPPRRARPAARPAWRRERPEAPPRGAPAGRTRKKFFLFEFKQSLHDIEKNGVRRAEGRRFMPRGRRASGFFQGRGGAVPRQRCCTAGTAPGESRLVRACLPSHGRGAITRQPPSHAAEPSAPPPQPPQQPPPGTGWRGTAHHAGAL